MNTPLRLATSLALVLFAAACDRKAGSSSSGETHSTTVSMPAATSAKSAVPNSFNEVAAQLDPGGSFYLYLSTQQWLSNLSGQLGQYREMLLNSANASSPAEREEMKKTF